MLLLHSYLWWRLVRATTRPGRARRWLTAAVDVLAVAGKGHESGQTIGGHGCG